MSSKKSDRLATDRIRREHRAARLRRAVRKLKGRLASPVTGRAAPSSNSKLEITLSVPPSFCFLTEPDAALRFIEEFAGVVCRTEVGKVTVDFGQCTTLGLCAYTVLYTTLVNAQNTRWYSPLSAFAKPSGSPEVNQLINLPYETPGPKPINIIRAPLIRGKGKNNQFSKERDKAGTEIVDYLTKCLATEGAELTPDGRKYLGNLITEAIGNAEEHSGPWVATGYFVQQHANDPGECHLVLFNEGPTICECIEDPKASRKIRDEAEKLASHHLNRGFFAARFLKQWTRETLLTLYALQQGVSSRLHERASRGNGTIQMIKAFSELAGRDQRMCILSGSAYIFFDGTYGLTEKQTTGTETREVIAFNKENDLQLPPDDSYVYALKDRFEGTVVSLRFRLARQQQTRLTTKRSAS